MTDDRNDLAFWYPRVRMAGLPVPETRIVKTDTPLYDILDGLLPATRWWQFVGELQEAAADLNGPPWFLRTGHASGKHEWKDTCYLPALTSQVIGEHVSRLVEWSACAGLFGLPVRTWAVREMIETDPLFRCRRFGELPVVREFRVFVRDAVIDEIYPYWPADALEPGEPDDPGWRSILADAANLSTGEASVLSSLAAEACDAVGGGYWSVDLLADAGGEFWLTDMALGDESWRPE